MSLKKQFSKTKPTCKVTFELPKEAVNGGKKVTVLGDFNNWDHKKGLKMKSGKNQFTATIELKTGKSYEFRYFIDGKNWTNDWDADAYRPSHYYGIENSVLMLEASPAVKKAASKKAEPKKVEKKIEKKAEKKAAKKTAAPKKVVTKKIIVKKVAPKKVAPKKAVKVTPDDLKKIEGVGPKIAGLLVKGGFPTFAALGKAKKTELKAILDAAGSRYQMHDPTTWAKQAKLAAAGKWEALGKLQDVLKGGK